MRIVDMHVWWVGNRAVVLETLESLVCKANIVKENRFVLVFVEGADIMKVGDEVRVAADVLNKEHTFVLEGQYIVQGECC